jgi:hypothetical protein
MFPLIRESPRKKNSLAALLELLAMMIPLRPEAAANLVQRE